MAKKKLTYREAMIEAARQAGNLKAPAASGPQIDRPLDSEILAGLPWDGARTSELASAFRNAGWPYTETHWLRRRLLDLAARGYVVANREDGTGRYFWMLKASGAAGSIPAASILPPDAIAVLSRLDGDMSYPAATIAAELRDAGFEGVTEKRVMRLRRAFADLGLARQGVAMDDSGGVCGRGYWITAAGQRALGAGEFMEGKTNGE